MNFEVSNFNSQESLEIYEKFGLIQVIFSSDLQTSSTLLIFFVLGSSIINKFDTNKSKISSYIEEKTHLFYLPYYFQSPGITGKQVLYLPQQNAILCISWMG